MMLVLIEHIGNAINCDFCKCGANNTPTSCGGAAKQGDSIRRIAKKGSTCRCSSCIACKLFHQPFSSLGVQSWFLQKGVKKNVKRAKGGVYILQMDG
jgi:hypothetical protein